MRNIQLGEKTYFENLDGLRFIFAVIVFFSHVEMLKCNFGFANIASCKPVEEMGTIAVTAFFVLSGFLITTILLREKRQYGSIDCKSFIKKRAKRIWPLYFFLTFLAYFVFNKVGIFSILSDVNLNIHHLHLQDNLPKSVEILGLLLFLPHVLAGFNEVFPIMHTWSIGVEEYFYVCWPIVLKKSASIKRTIISVIIGYLLLSFLMAIITLVLSKSHYKDVYGIVRSVYAILFMQRVSCMAIGALGAYYFLQNKIPVWIYHKFTQFILLSVIGLIFVKGIRIPIVGHEIFSVLFLMLILNTIRKDSFIVSLDYPILRWGGRISYGFYMYHNFVIIFSLWLLKRIFPEMNGIPFAIVIFLVSFTLTMFVAHLSYTYFESLFLRKAGMKLPQSIQHKPAFK